MNFGQNVTTLGICSLPKNSSVVYEDVSRSYRTGRLERELQIIELSATRCSCIAIL
jgi:hypothetical protein